MTMTNKDSDDARSRVGWFVGAFYHGSDDQMQRFVAEGIWENGYENKYLDSVRSMRPGDRIAIKSSYVRKNNLPFDNRGLSVSVMAVIGTMNIADRSLALVDLAFRRRFAFVDLKPKLAASWRCWIVEQCNVASDLLPDIELRITELNDQIASDARLGEQFRVGHSYVTPSDPLEDGGTQKWFRQVVATELGPLLKEYWFDAPDESRKAYDRLLHGW